MKIRVVKAENFEGFQGSGRSQSDRIGQYNFSELASVVLLPRMSVSVS